ncbi:hypothetical protein DFH09DRAFT_1106960 [Mycena vulgaris]|nr:hypothetical protein DFH09DRAFT_1106960 [Mycena vulgaris]
MSSAPSRSLSRASSVDTPPEKLQARPKIIRSPRVSLSRCPLPHGQQNARTSQQEVHRKHGRRCLLPFTKTQARHNVPRGPEAKPHESATADSTSGTNTGFLESEGRFPRARVSLASGCTNTWVPVTLIDAAVAQFTLDASYASSYNPGTCLPCYGSYSSYVVLGSQACAQGIQVKEWIEVVFVQGSQNPLEISPPVSFLDLDPNGAQTAAGIADIYLIEQLNLLPPQGLLIPRASNITLELENVLSSYVALTFWTAGHIPPVPDYAAGGQYNGTNISYSTEQVRLVPTLAKGEALVPQDIIQIRPDVSVGLAVSIALILLSLQFSPPGTAENGVPIEGTGILHSIWLYRNHPELPKLLEQVEHPTDDNLRKAGMVHHIQLLQPSDTTGTK